MNFYEPKYFGLKELVSREFYNRMKGRNILRMFDPRLLITADRIRVHFCGPKKHGAEDVMIANDWSWGGRFHARGLRHPVIDIIQSKIGNEKLSITGPHCFASGLDFHLRKTTIEEIRQDILANPNAERYEYITGLEVGVPWVHVDTRNWDKGSQGIFTFRA
jgi:hypothetical protein